MTIGEIISLFLLDPLFTHTNTIFKVASIQLLLLLHCLCLKLRLVCFPGQKQVSSWFKLVLNNCFPLILFSQIIKTLDLELWYSTVPVQTGRYEKFFLWLKEFLWRETVATQFDTTGCPNTFMGSLLRYFLKKKISSFWIWVNIFLY